MVWSRVRFSPGAQPHPTLHVYFLFPVPPSHRVVVVVVGEGGVSK